MNVFLEYTIFKPHKLCVDNLLVWKEKQLLNCRFRHSSLISEFQLCHDADKI